MTSARVRHARTVPAAASRDSILFTGRCTADSIKYASNAFLATKITFINEMADLCEKVGANVQDVARGMGLDRRIGRSSCMPGLASRLLPSEGDRRAGGDRAQTIAR